jgi:DUF1365 family protein
MNADRVPAAPCLYVGSVRHRRGEPRRHAFTMPLFMVYLDVDHLPAALHGRFVWTYERRGLVCFRRGDFLRPAALPLGEAVRLKVAAETGRRPEGPIRMLTHLRTWGYGFNPVTFYYCFDSTDSRIEAIVADITNTPWGERHAYVLPGGGAPGRPLWTCRRFRKVFHVSPFMESALDYDWRFLAPGRHLVVHMKNLKNGAPFFDATLVMRRKPWTRSERRRLLWRHPFMTGQVIAKIYWNALRLWLRGVPYHPHPGDPARGTGPSRPDAGRES